MNPELKARWVEALRSGEYEQGYAKLRSTDDTYCCLGVLYDIDVGDWVRTKSEGYLVGDRYANNHVSQYLQSVDVNWQASNKLVDMNDFERKTFAQIADWIEQNL